MKNYLNFETEVKNLENELENVIAKQSSDRISQSLRYKELLECEGETEVFDR